VGSYAANGWGLYDMLGNLSEWCKDGYDKDYQQRDPADTLNRVVRGGSWQSAARDCRSARRQPSDPARNNIVIGFRVVVRLREK
jgi:formylglycine-generating enzyme required for sulfatase activity